MATYELGPDRVLVARPQDLLHVEAFVPSDGLSLSLLFPSQHVMEWPRGGDVADRTTVPAIAADPGFDFISYNVTPSEVLALGDGLLARLHRQPGRGHVQLPTMVQLRTFGDGTWDLSPTPRTGAGGWTAVWYAELLSTERPVEGLSGPILEVFTTQDPGFEPPGFGIVPFTLFPDLRQTVFEARLRMSALGASGRIRGPHDHPSAQPGGAVPTLTSYDHTVQLGRDQTVTSVVQGRLTSGHRAEMTIVTRREFARMRFTNAPIGEQDEASFGAGNWVQARLFSTATLNVIEPVVSFEGMDTPFRTLRISPRTVGQLELHSGTAAPVSWVERKNGHVHFNLVATDWAGREVAYTMPLMFVVGNAAGLTIDSLRQMVMAQTPDHHSVDLGGASVALADPGSQEDDDLVASVTMPVHTVSFDLVASSVAGMERVLLPKTVDVALEAVGRLTSQARTATCALMHKVDEAHNFLKMVEDVPVVFPAAQAGGLASPASVLSAVNTLKGAIPEGSVQEMFKDAKLLGANLLDLLGDIVPEVEVPGELPKPRIPDLTTVKLPTEITTTYHWMPHLKTGQTDGLIQLKDKAELELVATLRVPIDVSGATVGPPESTIKGHITKVTISIFGVIDVFFERVDFDDLPHQSPTLRPSGIKVTFKDQLSFVEELAKAVKEFAEDSPIHIDETAITAGYELPLPAVPLGIFNLSNVALGAEIKIPFNSDPTSARFHFSERAAPFNLSVEGLGGGGFLAITASTRQLELVEGALEFGGNLEFDVVVAKGQVDVMGGVAVKWTPEELTVGGYLRCGGHVEVLDLVTVSVEFEMSLSYTTGGGHGTITGRASVTVSISVLLLHESVSFSVEKSLRTDSLGGSDSTRSAFLLDVDGWDELCDAFAPLEPVS